MRGSTWYLSFYSILVLSQLGVDPCSSGPGSNNIILVAMHSLSLFEPVDNIKPKRHYGLAVPQPQGGIGLLAYWHCPHQFPPNYLAHQSQAPLPGATSLESGPDLSESSIYKESVSL